MSTQCPKCKQYKVITQAGLTIMTGGVFNLIGVFLLILPPIGLTLIGIGWVMILFGIVSLFIPSNRTKFYCNNCKYKWDSAEKIN